jgi:hypothetical protein
MNNYNQTEHKLGVQIGIAQHLTVTYISPQAAKKNPLFIFSTNRLGKLY